jgi:ubiquinone biosynthesis O-methyltransferase
MDNDALAELPAAYAAWRESRLGHVTDALELDFILDLTGPVRGLHVLDVGCGDGHLALALARAGAQVSGVDPDPRMLRLARCRFEEAGVTVNLAEAQAQALPFEDARFDVVVAVTVLCFVGRPEQAVAEMARVLRPGGRLMIGELGRFSTWAAWRRIRGWLGHATWRAARFRTAADLHRLAAGAGLDAQSVRGAVFYPPYGWTAAMLAPLDKWLGRRFIVGAAFLGLSATKSADPAGRLPGGSAHDR